MAFVFRRPFDYAILAVRRWTAPSVAASVVTGTGAVSIGTPVLAAAGTFTTTGSGAVSIVKPVLAAAGTFATTGSGAVAVGPPALAGTGTFTTTGTGAVAIPTPVLAGTGTFATTGTGSITIGAPQVSASGPMFSFRDVGDSGTIVNGTPRVANIGTWDTVTDTGTRASILSTLDFAGSPGAFAFGGGSSLGWHDPSLVESLARADIGAAVFAIRHQVGTSLVFHGLTTTSKPAAPDDAGIGIHRIASNYELHLAMNGLGTTNVKPARQSQYLRNCVLYAIVVPRPTGYLLFMSGGSWGTLPEASLVWVYETGTSDPLFLSHSAHTGEWQGRAQVVTPGSLTNELRAQNGIAVAYDSFDRADGALAGSQTETGGYTWTNGTGATSSIVSNKLAVTAASGTVCNLIDTGLVPSTTNPVRVEIDVERGATGNLWLGIVLRADSTGANRIQFNLTNTAWFLNENGGAGQISTGGYTASASTVHRLIAIDYGTRIKLFILNKTTGVLSQVDGGNGIATTYRNTSTIVGVVRSTSSDTGANLFDNLAVWPGRVTLPAFLFEGHTAAPDVGGATLYTDAFGGADGTLLTTPWALNGATAIEQRSGKARLVSAASEGQATIDTGLTDIGVTASITIPASGDPNFYGLFVRWADASNNVMIRILYQSGSPEYEMIERIAGVSTVVQAVQLVTGTIVLGGTYAVKVVAKGNRIAAYLDGELVHEYSTTLTAGTRVGLGSPVGTAVSAGVPTWDDLSIFVPLGGTPPASITGTGAVAIGAPSLAGTGTFATTGTGALAIGAPVLAGTGTVTDASGVTGTGAITIGTPALAGTGTFTTTGSGALTIAAPVLSGAGTFATTGAGAVSIAAPVLAGDGTFTTTGTGAVTIAAPVLAGSGTFSAPGAITGTGAIEIGPPVLAGAGTFTTTGSGALTINLPSLAATGTFTTAGSGAVSIPAPVLAGTGSFATTGAGAITIAAPVLAGSGTFSAPGAITGTGDITISAPLLSAAGSFTPAPITGTGSLTITAPAVAGTGAFETTGSGSLTIAQPSLSGAGTFATVGTGAVTIGGPSVSAVGIFTITGTSVITISAPGLAGTGDFTTTGIGAVTIGPPSLSGAEVLPTPPGTVGGGSVLVGSVGGYYSVRTGTAAGGGVLVGSVTGGGAP